MPVSDMKWARRLGLCRFHFRDLKDIGALNFWRLATKRHRLKCRYCGITFLTNRTTRQYCSLRCHLARQCAKHRKLPAASALIKEYLVQLLSTVKIARKYKVTPKTVRSALMRAGVQLRRCGPTTTASCVEKGCGNPIQKIKHPINGSIYGRRCKRHWKLHRARLGRVYRRKVLGVPKDRWLVRD